MAKKKILVILKLGFFLDSSEVIIMATIYTQQFNGGISRFTIGSTVLDTLDSAAHIASAFAGQPHVKQVAVDVSLPLDSNEFIKFQPVARVVFEANTVDPEGQVSVELGFTKDDEFEPVIPGQQLTDIMGDKPIFTRSIIEGAISSGQIDPEVYDKVDGDDLPTLAQLIMDGAQAELAELKQCGEDNFFDDITQDRERIVHEIIRECQGLIPSNGANPISGKERM